ncbi:hypothetical protein ACWDAZ_23470, partial [Streptomyces sp. NPDC001215]
MSALPRTADRPCTPASSDVGDAVARWLAPVHDHPRLGEPLPGTVTLHHFGYAFEERRWCPAGSARPRARVLSTRSVPPRESLD